MARTSDKLIDQIKNDIFSGVLRPGDQLEESDLAERFGVSRTPIREAIRSMVDCGLLETRPRKGAIVRRLTVKELHDLFEVAAEMEGMACRLASENLTQIHRGAIKAALDLCAHAADTESIQDYASANLAFHGAIHEASGNVWLIDQLQQIEARINVYRLMPYEIVGRLQKSMQEHIEIFKAITQGRAEDANTLMRSHMMLQGQRLPNLLKALEV
ncbi:MAG: DNA-binding GntR family transcriptional regulator [Paracoccaceae bacterium]|jgi:DNA-binding GntR family transcriptional regulator